MPTAVAAPIAGAAAGKILGGGGTGVAIPSDMQGMRGQQINLLNQLLGLGTPSAPRHASGLGGTNFQNVLHPQAQQALGAGGDPLSRLQQFFGQLGTPTSALQRQSLGGLQQLLSQPSQGERALNLSMPALQGILGQAPGAGIMNALQPQFQRNLATANAQGGRFSSANAVLRSRALDDFNLLGAQAAQQGIGQQLQASQILGMLGQNADQGVLGRLMGAYGIGQQQAGQDASGQQQAIGLLQQLLGTAQGAALNLPITQSPSGAQQGAALGGQIGQALIMQKLLGGPAGTTSAPGVGGNGQPFVAGSGGVDPSLLALLGVR